MTERAGGDCSLHETEKPDLCPNGNHANWRVVRCDSSDTDTLECSRCGKQRETPCTFDEDYN